MTADLWPEKVAARKWKAQVEDRNLLRVIAGHCAGDSVDITTLKR